MKKIGVYLIDYYKQFFNPLFPNRCKFTPSCSAYMAQSVNKHGAVGVVYGVWRLLRCNPFTKGGFDPVKENYIKARWLL